MHVPSQLYRHSLALLTDLYQLTMAYGYWKAQVADKEAVFHLFFRQNPFQGGFSIACGLGYALDFLTHFRFDAGDVAYLAELRGADGQPLFEPAFLDYLHALELTCRVDAIPEGTVVFPQEPLVRVQGPILQCQIIETALLNLINFQTLIATKAARVCLATHGDPVLEFGLRRAQGIDGTLAASRAAYIGGCAATSNVLAGKLFGIPVRGTHAHSWVMAFGDELEAFQAYAEAMPNNCVFLVDTYDSLEGVRKAVQVGAWLRERGHDLVGIRLDSGDISRLSVEARGILDAAGFPDAMIVGSNDLDEQAIADLKAQGATINVWGVGTHLVTASGQPALGGVYKLTALRDAGGAWQHKIKLSEDPEKTTLPGILQVRRFHDDAFREDVIYDEALGMPVAAVPLDEPSRAPHPVTGRDWTDLLVPVLRDGRAVYTEPSLADIRTRTQTQLGRLPDGVAHLRAPHGYPVGLESRLHTRKAALIREARGSRG